MALAVLVLFVGFASYYGFLLDGTTPDPNLGLTDKHYITVIDMIQEEKKARQQLEVYVTQLHRELEAKTSVTTSNNGENKTCVDCLNQIRKMDFEMKFMKQRFENELQAVQQKLSQVESENAILKDKNVQLELGFKNVSGNFEEFIKGINALKTIDQGQALISLQNETKTLKEQVNILTNNQLARGQDFLALFNQTMFLKAELKHDVMRQTNQILHHNVTLTELKSSLDKSVNESKNATQNLDIELKVMSARITNETLERGTTYVRWSRKQCPSHTELVYSGYAGGGTYSESGSSAEPVCLPPDPDFNKTTAYDGGHMYGAEFIGRNFFASDSNGQDIPCAVCRVRQASSSIMIPGKKQCFDGWRLEYHGYLASNNHAEPAAGSYTCIDIQPEYVAGGLTYNGNSKVFYPVIAKCGSLRCPPYKQDHPLTCVVCSK